MASSQKTESLDSDKESKKLHDIFLEGWNDLEAIENSSLPFNSREYQVKFQYFPNYYYH